ncbi:MAG: hypothetical protein ACFB0C_20890 [Leptolyngbyaceae cyanobacterium]
MPPNRNHECRCGSNTRGDAPAIPNAGVVFTAGELSPVGLARDILSPANVRESIRRLLRDEGLSAGGTEATRTNDLVDLVNDLPGGGLSLQRAVPLFIWCHHPPSHWREVLASELLLGLQDNPLSRARLYELIDERWNANCQCKPCNPEGWPCCGDYRITVTSDLFRADGSVYGQYTYTRTPFDRKEPRDFRWVKRTGTANNWDLLFNIWSCFFNEDSENRFNHRNILSYGGFAPRITNIEIEMINGGDRYGCLNPPPAPPPAPPPFFHPINPYLPFEENPMPIVICRCDHEPDRTPIVGSIILPDCDGGEDRVFPYGGEGLAGLQSFAQAVSLALPYTVNCGGGESLMGLPEDYGVYPEKNRPTLIISYKERKREKWGRSTFTSTIWYPSDEALTNFFDLKINPPPRESGPERVDAKLSDESILKGRGATEGQAFQHLAYLISMVEPFRVPSGWMVDATTRFESKVAYRTLYPRKIEYYANGFRAGISPTTQRYIDPPNLDD